VHDDEKLAQAFACFPWNTSLSNLVALATQQPAEPSRRLSGAPSAGPAPKERAAREDRRSLLIFDEHFQ
jgi:hypothetical protein